MSKDSTAQDPPDGFIAALGLGELVILLAVSPWKGYVALKGTGEQRKTWFSAMPPMTPSASWPPPERLTADTLLDLFDELLPPGSRVARDDIRWRWNAKPPSEALP
jgi:hypothetical protein